MSGVVKMKKASTILIILGVLIAAYPLLERGYTWYWQQKVLAEYEESLSDITDTTVEEYNSLQSFFIEQLEQQQVGENLNQEEAPVDPPEEPVEEPKQQAQPKPKANTLGVLKIEKINLSLPILEGATERNLLIGAAKVKGTSVIGEIGNTALAGHRSQTFGRFFNRLDELEIGDSISIETPNGTYQYEIYKKYIVEPDDVSVLNRNRKDKILTLITCTPINTATHRLIIHAKQI